jgi:hypothetical protein
MRASVLLGMVGVLVLGASGMAVGLPNGNQFSPYTLQLSDIGAGFYKLRGGRPLSNARAIKEGTPAIIIRRFGRLGGYERDFDAKHVSKEDLVEIGSTVVGTRTAAGAHSYFLWATKPSRIKRMAKGVTLHALVRPRVGAESRCYAFRNKINGFAFLNFVCYWRQNRLLGSLVAAAFWERRLEVPLIVPFTQLTMMQARRMALFS